MNEKRLGWVRDNRQPHDRVARVGALLTDVRDGGTVARARRLQQLREVIAAGTDAEFRRHCTLGEVSGGVVTILVDQESRVLPMRLDWHTRLAEWLATRRCGVRVGQIRFAQGEGGLVFEDEDTEAGPAASEFEQRVSEDG